MPGGGIQPFRESGVPGARPVIGQPQAVPVPAAPEEPQDIVEISPQAEQVPTAPEPLVANPSLSIVCRLLERAAERRDASGVRSAVCSLERLLPDCHNAEDLRLVLQSALLLQQARGGEPLARRLYNFVLSLPQDQLQPEELAQVRLAGRCLGEMNLPTIRTQDGGRIRFATFSQEGIVVPEELIDVPAGSAMSRVLPTETQALPDNFAQFFDDWVSANGNVLTELGIADVRHMSPQEAAALSARFVEDHLAYDDTDLSHVSDSPDPQEVFQNLLRGRGVCRHYAIATNLVFDYLRTTYVGQLANSYILFQAGRSDDLGGDRSEGHAWCILVSQVSQGEWVMQAIDPSTHDSAGGGFDAMLDGPGTFNCGTQLDLVFSLARDGVISREEAIRTLNDYVDNNPNSPRIPFAYWYLAALSPGGSNMRRENLQAIVDLGNNPLADNASRLLETRSY